MTTFRKLPISSANRNTTAVKSRGASLNNCRISISNTLVGARPADDPSPRRSLYSRPAAALRAYDPRDHGSLAPRPQITAPILKIGRYMATTRPPTSTPRMAMIIGSSRLLRLSTALSTSSS
jgi:hypothetical protein